MVYPGTWTQSAGSGSFAAPDFAVAAGVPTVAPVDAAEPAAGVDGAVGDEHSGGFAAVGLEIVVEPAAGVGKAVVEHFGGLAAVVVVAAGWEIAVEFVDVVEPVAEVGLALVDFVAELGLVDRGTGG